MVSIVYRNLAPNGGRSISGCEAKEPAPAGTLTMHRRSTQRLSAVSLLNDLIEHTLGPSLTYRLVSNSLGKPVLITPGVPSAIEVSLSHSGPMVMAGISDIGPIGVDVEHRALSRSIQEIAAYSFGPLERSEVQACGRQAFFKIWTLREALSKAAGVGFPILTDRRDYFAKAPKSGTWQTSIHGSPWLFATTELPGDYSASIAIALRSCEGGIPPSDLTPREFP